MNPGTKLGPYEILALIGAGGMGQVYRARDTRLDREVAVKVSSQQFTERFEREARTVASLNHPNICALYDVGPNYLVMEYVEGEAPKGPYALDDALKIAWQIADALTAAHEKGITHRDLKPANIRIRPDGSVKVLDFGLAKVGRSSTSGETAIDASNSPTLSASMTEAGMVLGTAAYMAPEQAKGKAVDKRADVWSFGVVVYELLTGQRLFQGDDVGETLAQVIMKEPDLSAVPPKVQRLLRSCLQKNPQQRLHDIADARLLLDEHPSAQRSPEARLGAAWLWPSIAAVLLVALSTMAVVHFRETPPAAPEPMRFEVSVPEDVVPLRGAVLSPDGRKLVFPAVGSDGVRRLWLRAVDEVDARPIAGTERSAGTRPFWSYDGRFVAFEADGKLKKIDVAGGQAQTLCDVPLAVLGGSWNRDGVIIFGSNVGGVMRVPDSGGMATPVTAPARSPEFTDMFPSFLPDGRHFLYRRSTSRIMLGGRPAATAEGTGVYVGSVDAKPDEQGAQQLVANVSGPIYVTSPDRAMGYLLFLRDTTLFAQPFDDRQLKLAGDAVPIVEQVGIFNGDAMFSASTNGSVIYRGGLARPAQLTWFDRQGNPLGVGAEPVDAVAFVLSPDGTKVAFQNRNLTRNISVVELSRGVSTRVTFDAAVAPLWSPDGGRVAYWANRGLYQKAANGTGAADLLLESQEVVVPTDWSRDGRFLFYTAAGSSPSRGDVWALPLERDRKPFSVLRDDSGESQAHLSPDGRWIAYLSNEAGTNEIYVRSFSPPSSTRAAVPEGKWLVSKGGGTEPRWRRDGRELFYLGAGGNVMAVDVTAGPVFQPGPPKPLFQIPPGAIIWDVAPDGERFLLPVLVADNRAPFTLVMNWMAGLKK